MPHRHEASGQQQPSAQHVVGPSSFLLHQQALMRAHRHVNSLLESLDEDGPGSCEWQQDRLGALIRQKAGYLRLRPDGSGSLPNGSGAVGGDQQHQQHQQHQQRDGRSPLGHCLWDATACSLQRPPGRAPAAHPCCTPAGGDQSRPGAGAPVPKLTVTETSLEVLRHQPCPLRRRPKQLPKPPQLLQRRLASSESSMQAVTDSLMTSTSSSTSSASVGGGGVNLLSDAAGEEDEDAQPATCSDAFTDESGSESPPLLQQQLLPAASQATIAIQLLNSTAEEARHWSTKLATEKAVGPTMTRAPDQSLSSSTSIASSTAGQGPSLTPPLPEFTLPAAMWSGAAAFDAAKSAKSRVVVMAAPAPAAARSQLVKQPPIPKLPTAKEKRQHQKRLPPPPPPPRCPSLHHGKQVGTQPSAARDQQFNQTNQATSTATSTATSATGTPLAVRSQAEAVQLSATVAALARRQHRHQHQHYQQLPRRRLLRRRELRPTCAYLPSDSFSAVACTAPTTATADEPATYQSTTVAAAASRPSMQLQRPLISRTEPPPEILAAVAATSDAQLLADRIEALRPSQVHVAAQLLPAWGGSEGDLLPPWSHCASSVRCYRCCLTLISGSALYQRVTASQLPPQPTLRRNLRQRALVSVHRRGSVGDVYSASDDAQSVVLLLRHHRSDCHLMERLSVTARLLPGARNCPDEVSTPTRSALMSRVFYPEELTVLLPGANCDLAPNCDDGASCNSNAESCANASDRSRLARPSAGWPEYSSQSAPWSVAASSAKLRARMACASDAVRLAPSSATCRNDAADNDMLEQLLSDSDSDDFSDAYEYDEVYRETDDIRESDVASTDDCSSSSGF